MPLKSLEEFNNEAYKRHIKSKEQPNKNGIACPDCGEEMYDSAPHITFTSFPPQTAVACKCGFKGNRIV